MKKSVKIGITIGVILLLIICGVTIYIFLNNRKENDNQLAENNENSQNNVLYEEIDEVQTEEEIQRIEEIKNETGLTADTNIYEVQEEYDGRQVLAVKSSVQYRVALAGMLTQEKPELDQIDEILETKRPNKSGIWVTERSRDRLIQYIQSTANNQYEVDQEGYLKVQQESTEKTPQDEMLEKFINGEKQYIIDISGMFYQVDNVTGEIIEYPFEMMDMYQTYEYVESNGNIVISLTQNTNQKLTSNEIIESVLSLFENYSE